MVLPALMDAALQLAVRTLSFDFVGQSQVSAAIGLRARYPLPGTDLAYAPTRMRASSWYDPLSPSPFSFLFFFLSFFPRPTRVLGDSVVLT